MAHSAKAGPEKKLGSQGVAMDISIERLCIENGLKMTGPRRVIARVLSEATDHPDVDELHRRANRIDERISLATVYRTVRLLEGKGILERRDLGSRRARYEPSGEGSHFHLVDQENGKVLEFSAPDAEVLLRNIAASHGFDVALIKIELFGRRAVAKGADDDKTAFQNERAAS
jgi:Fur family ferric uptake transcriptional regulator